MDRKLLDYLPAYLQEIYELRSIMEAEDQELKLLHEKIGATADDFHLVSLSNLGLKRWEQMLGITPTVGSTIQERRERVLLEYLVQTPYTHSTLERFLQSIGSDVAVDIDPYKLYIKIQLNSIRQRSWLQRALREMVPANIGIALKVAQKMAHQNIKLYGVTASNYLVRHGYKILNTGGPLLRHVAYANSPDGVQDFSLTPDGHTYIGLYQGLDIDSLRGNRVRNSNFENGDYWNADLLNLRIADNSAHLTYINNTDDVVYDAMQQETPGISKAGDKYYVSFEVCENNNTASAVIFATDGPITTVPNGFNGKLSAVYTPEWGDDLIAFYSEVRPNEILDYKIKNVFIVNLTEEYGAGNEPTKEYMDSLSYLWTRRHKERT